MNSMTVLIILAVVQLIILVVLFLRRSSTTHDTLLDQQLKNIQDEFPKNREESTRNLRETREELRSAIDKFGELLVKQLSAGVDIQKNQLDHFARQIQQLTTTNTQSLDRMSKTIEDRLKHIQEDTNLKLEKMRETVDEKLHKTLEQRLGESFRIVSERLELVHKGLGEMQHLATGVGDLKKVLSNVKTRGVLGEVQLGNILEQILTPDQYDRNVKTKQGSNDLVEFAIKLPGKKERETVYLPLDSKFPLETYHSLICAYDEGNTQEIDALTKQLENDIKKCAKDIHEKYIDVPHTTDFGILFVPIEGLYAEIVRKTSLLDTLQRELKIIVTGPTTLAALLNSLQMGFRTLMIEKRSSEVWSVLAAVKSEFDTFGDVLQKAQERIRQADTELDRLVGTRTKQIQRKLKTVESLPEQVRPTDTQTSLLS